jgi:hypothetical protein
MPSSIVMALPVSGRAAVEKRWAALEPLLSRADAELLD